MIDSIIQDNRALMLVPSYKVVQSKAKAAIKEVKVTASN